MEYGNFDIAMNCRFVQDIHLLNLYAKMLSIWWAQQQTMR